MKIELSVIMMTNTMRKTKSRRRKVILDAPVLLFIIIFEVDDSKPTTGILWVRERNCQVEMAITYGYSDELINCAREARLPAAPS